MTLEEIRKKYGIKTTDKKTTKEEDKSESGKMTLDEIRKKYGLSSGVDQDYINSFVADAEKYSSADMADSYRVWNELDLGSRANAIRGYLDKNESSYTDKNAYKQFSDAINSYLNIGKEYSTFADEKAYGDWYKSYQNTLALETTNLNELDAEINRLESELENELKSSESKNKDEEWWETLGRWLGSGGPTDTSLPLGIANSATTEGVNEYALELKSLISSKKAYRALAERTQSAKKLEESALADPNFDMYAQNGITSGENYASKLRNDLEAREKFETQRDTVILDSMGMMMPTITSDQAKAYKVALYLEEDEFEIYSYYLAKDKENGTNLAEQYLINMADYINEKEGADKYEHIKDSTIQKYLFGLEAGTEQFTSGLVNLFSGEDYLPTSATQVASGLVRESLADRGVPWYNAKTGEWEDWDVNVFGSSWGQMNYDAITTTANMLPSMLTSAAVGLINPTAGTVVGAALLGTSAAGNAKAEMLKLGYSKEQATAYGIMVGIAEGSMEYFLGHIPGLSKGSGIFSTLATKAVSKIDNALARVAIAIGGAFDEALEEGLQEVIDHWLREAATGVDWDAPNVDEVLYSSLLGALSSIGLGSGQSAINTGANAILKNQAYIEHGQSIIDKGGVDPLKALSYEVAKSMEKKDSKEINRLTSKVEKKASARNVGKLSAQLEGKITKQNRAAFESALEKNGLSKKEAKLAADYLSNKDNLSDAEKRKVETDERYQEAITEALADQVLNGNNNISELNAARQGKTFEEVLNSSVKNDTINESEANTDEGEGIHLRDSSERNDGADTEGSVFDLESSSGKNKSWRKAEQFADGEAARLVNEGREVSVASRGVLRGSKNHTVRLLDVDSDPSLMTPLMKEAYSEAKARGLNLKFFVGDNLVIADKNGKLFAARGYIVGNTMLVRADHPYYTAEQIARHEIGHDMIAKGEVNIDEVRKKLAKIADKESVDYIAEKYVEAYKGTNLTPDEIWEECICDSLGDMNIFGSEKEENRQMSKLIPSVKEATESTTKSPTQTRGSPEGKASFDFNNGINTAQDYENYGWVRDNDVISAGYWANFTTNFAKALNNKNFDRITPSGEYMIEVYDQNLYEKDQVIDHIVFAKGTIESPDITKIVKFNFDNEFDIYPKRRNLYEAERRGIRQEAGEIFDIYYKADFIGGRINQGNSAKSFGNNNRLDTKRSRSEIKTNPITEFHVDEDKNTITYTYSNGETFTEPLGDTPKEAEGHKQEGKASIEFSSPEEAKDSGKISDAKFSIEFADDIANKQRKYAEDGLSRISSEELEKAIADTAHMVNEMKPYANILPQDKVGKTLVKNGSYDVSVENTTVCIRTLAYNSFVDMVSEKVGRPLTQMESFLVSQKLYEIAKEPQCLYCYVSLDRKAFNEMVIRYTEQRDAAIKAYEDAGKPKIPSKMDAEWSLFKEFLDGRKPTTNMWDRYVGWLKAYNNGETLVSLSDISTEARRLALVEKGGEAAAQVKDILKYAQSASWAKKQTQYVAYNSEILKLKPQVIRNLNSHYGMRWYSFSDYSGAFIVENMQQITDAAVKGLKGLSYTKDTDFAEIFAPTGMNINISVYATKTANGYEIDAKQSANIDEAIKLREKYPNVGIVVVATDKGGVEWALAQEWSDVVIPFHTVRTGADVAEFYNWEIFNAEQSDTVTDQNLWDAYLNEVGKKKASKNVYPSEHQNNKDTYLAICEKRGLTPRFKSFLENPNYMKLVNETRQSEGETTPLKAKFDVGAAERSFDKFVEKGGYYEGWYNDGIDVDGEAEIVAEDVRAGRKANEVSYGRQDVNFEDVAKGRKTNREHGKASRELDVIDYIDEQAEREGTERVGVEPLSNREILANALESIAQNEIEQKKLTEYKDNINKMNAESAKLAELKKEIKELTFGKGKKNPEKLKTLKAEATKTENRINLYDKKLLSLETASVLKDVLEREKRKAYSRAAQKGREAMHRNVEGRRKTEMRYKIKNVAHDLESLLERGTKERNVKKGQSELVRRVLDLSDMLFATDDELILGGIETDLSDREKLAVAEFKALYDEYHSYDESVTENKEKRKELRTQMNEKKKALAETLERERKRISKAKASGIFDALAKEYEALKTSKDKYLSGAFKPEVLEHLKTLRANIGEEITLKEMTLSQLEDVYTAVSMVKKSVQDANKIFRNGRAEDIKSRLRSIYNQLGNDIKDKKELPEWLGKVLNKINEFGWDNLRPVDVFEILGSESFSELYWDIITAQSVYAKDAAEVGMKLVEARKKHGYKRWDIKADLDTFETADGQKFALTLGEAMAIYAYSKREQAGEHFRVGGFQFADDAVHKENGVYKLRNQTVSTYRIDDALLSKIISKLSKEQIAYVDDMQKLLTDWGEKGNEQSRILYGIDLFTEEVYFPLFSSKDYISSVQNELGATATTASLLSQGMTKPVTPGANNPVILRAFDDVILEHFDKMSKYHAYAVTIDNFRKVFDSNVEVSEDKSISLRSLISAKYGKAATTYLQTYLTDLNGSATMSGASAPTESFFGKAKAVAVGANISVWIQQYFSIIRATGEINPKYFMPFLGEKFKNPDMKLYEEMKKYAPVTIIKEMGGFDVGSNSALNSYIGFDEAKMTKDKLWAKTQEYTGIGANLMDRLGWMTIWAAVKKEVAATGKYKVGSEEYLKACGKRFEEVVTKTQVYDSVNSRSGYMRSPHDLVKYLTSFMGEPTVVVGRLISSTVNFVRNPKSGKNVGRFVSSVASVVVAQALTAIAKSLVSALRDKDEDEAYREKLVQAISRNLTDDLNPMGYFPVLRDIASLIDGYDVERPDMTLIADLLASAYKLVDDFKNNTAEEWLGFASSFASMFGLPLGNVIRDVRGLVNTIQNAEKEYKLDLGKHFKEGAFGNEQASKYEDIFDALDRRDTDRTEYYKSTYKTESQYLSAVRTSIGERYKSGEISRAKATSMLTKYGDYDENDAYWKLKEWDYKKKYGNDAEWTKYNEFYTAVKTGKNLKAVIKDYLDHGVTKDTLASQITSYYKPMYKKMSKAQRASLKGYLLNAYQLLGYKRADKSKDIDNWLKDK